MVDGNASIASALAAVVKIQQIEIKENLIEQDAYDRDLYFILMGEFEVTVNGRSVATRVAKSHTGEMALIDSSSQRSATVTALKTSVVAAISPADFTLIANQHPRMWQCIAQTLSERLRERAKFHKQPNDIPAVFIASSGEALDSAKNIQAGIESDQIKVNVWTNDIFGVSEVIIESLETMLALHDFGIVVLAPDDVIESRGLKKVAPRDNCILELGLLIGAFGRKRTFMVMADDSDLKLPSDILGITRLSLATIPGSTPAKVYEKLKRKILDLGPR